MMKASSNIIFHIYASENYCKNPFAGVEIRLFQRSKKERELCDVAVYLATASVMRSTPPNPVHTVTQWPDFQLAAT